MKLVNSLKKYNRHPDKSNNIIEKDVIRKLLDLGGVEFVNKMIESATENISNRISEIQQAISGRDFKLLEKAAHSIISSAGNMGAYQLMNEARVIEELSISAKPEDLDDIIGRLVDLFELAKIEIKITQQEFNEK